MRSGYEAPLIGPLPIKEKAGPHGPAFLQWSEKTTFFDLGGSFHLRKIGWLISYYVNCALHPGMDRAHV